MNNLLIIGCGYLGRRVAQLWQGRQPPGTVQALTRTAENASILTELNIVPIIGDVLDAWSLKNLPPVETVLYAVGLDRKSNRSMREVYVEGLGNVLRQVAPHTRRFIYISSTSVYGQSHGEWIDESSPCIPTRDNGVIQLEAEQLVHETFADSHDRQAVILRLSGIYGPGRLLRRLEEVRSAKPIDGNPNAFLNLIHGDDAARIAVACATRSEPSATYLVSDDCPVTRREYYERLASLAGAPEPVFAAEGDVSELNKRCSNKKCRTELGIDLQFPTIAEGLPHAIGGHDLSS